MPPPIEFPLLTRVVYVPVVFHAPFLTVPAAYETISCPHGEEPQKQRPRQKRRSRLFGWLYRSVRNVEIERGGAPPLLFYLRSPLLAGFADETDCPPQEHETEPAEDVCASVVAYGEKDIEESVEVGLPLFAAATAPDLLDAIRDRLENGLVVVLSGLDGTSHTLAPGRVRQLEVRPCEPDADDEGKHLV